MNPKESKRHRAVEERILTETRELTEEVGSWVMAEVNRTVWVRESYRVYQSTTTGFGTADNVSNVWLTIIRGADLAVREGRTGW